MIILLEMLTDDVSRERFTELYRTYRSLMLSVANGSGSSFSLRTFKLESDDEQHITFDESNGAADQLSERINLNGASAELLESYENADTVGAR